MEWTISPILITTSASDSVIFPLARATAIRLEKIFRSNLVFPAPRALSSRPFRASCSATSQTLPTPCRPLTYSMTPCSKSGDSIAINYGNHAFTSALNCSTTTTTIFYPGNEGLAGFFNFNGQYTGNGAPHCPSVPGLPTSCSDSPAIWHLGKRRNRHLRNNLWGVYAQDNWRLRRHLT